MTTTSRTTTPDPGPALRLLSLGAGVQSTTVLLLACEGEIPRFDAALFADTGWEPHAVYTNLDRLTAHARRHGIPVRRVSAGNIRTDALDPQHRFVSMHLHTLNPDGSRGLARRQCSVVCTISRWLIMALHTWSRRSQWTFAVSSWKAVRPCPEAANYLTIK